VRDHLSLMFLKKNNHTDMLLINKIKESLPPKNTMLHSACIWMNGMMNAYTTNDTFIKDNMQWISQATNWNRFQATSTLGMIHM
jgi:26S proteasome regulatory subunit N2